MSRSLADRLRRGADDGGFGIVEILIAMTIFAIVAVATAPLLVGGLKAGRASQLNLQGKGLAQERLEIMRNLPFHVARQNGQYLDVLDIYFRDLQPTGTLASNDQCDARSYSVATSTYTCSITDLGVDYPGFSQVIRATFLGFERNTVVPPTGYSSQVEGSDGPASSLLGVAVTTSWRQGDRTSSYTLRSHVANAEADESALRASLGLAALTVTSSLADEDILQFEGGLLNAEGSLTTGSTASLNITSARAGLASGLSKTGATVSLSAPPAANVGVVADTDARKLYDNCNVACFGKSRVSGDRSVTVDLGQPQASSVGTPAVASLLRVGGSDRGFNYNNAVDADEDALLRLAGPMVSAGAGSTTELLRSSGFVDATGTGATAVTSAGAVAVPMVQLFPTDFAPDGVVQLSLASASLACSSGGGGGAVTGDWQGTVSYWQQTGLDSNNKPVGGYVSSVVEPGGSDLPLTSVAVLKADADGVGGNDGVHAADIPLSRWIESWSGMKSAAAAGTPAGTISAGSISAIISVITAPTRGAANPTSAINVALGTLNCHAEDNR